MASEEASGAMSGAAQGAAMGTAIMPGWGTAVGAVVGGIGGFMGGSAAKKKAKEAAKLREAAMAQYANINIPDIEKMRLYMEQLESQGQLTPEMYEAAKDLEASEMTKIEQDPRLKGAQMSALEKLQDMSDDGFTDSDIAAFRQAERQNDRQAQADQQSILANMAARGVAGSGNELAARLMASQQADNRRAQSSDSISAQARQRALEALTQSANLGGTIRQQDFSQNSAIAQAQDAIAKFNLQNRQQVGQQNVGLRNDAQKYNLSEAQRIADQNAANNNYAQQYNSNLHQTNFSNQMLKADKMAAALMGQANQAQAQGAQAAQNMQNMVQGIGQMAGSYYAGQQVKPAGSGGSYQADLSNSGVGVAGGSAPSGGGFGLGGNTSFGFNTKLPGEK